MSQLYQLPQLPSYKKTDTTFSLFCYVAKLIMGCEVPTCTFMHLTNLTLTGALSRHWCPCLFPIKLVTLERGFQGRSGFRDLLNSCCCVRAVQLRQCQLYMLPPLGVGHVPAKDTGKQKQQRRHGMRWDHLSFCRAERTDCHFLIKSLSLSSPLQAGEHQLHFKQQKFLPGYFQIFPGIKGIILLQCKISFTAYHSNIC